jgi:sec-independent protein translocase protein TatA
MHNILLFGTIGWAEVLIIAFLVLLLFGGKKIPELMKGIGKGVKSFKEGVKGVEEDATVVIDDDDDKKSKETKKTDGGDQSEKA